MAYNLSESELKEKLEQINDWMSKNLGLSNTEIYHQMEDAKNNIIMQLNEIDSNKSIDELLAEKAKEAREEAADTKKESQETEKVPQEKDEFDDFDDR